MVRENVKFTNPNFTGDGTYFYSMVLSSQVLQVKVDDGSIAFTYPLATSLGNTVKELEWDGVYFWSLEPKTGGIIIRKWGIQSFICQQVQLFEFTNGTTHTYDADAFSLEHYRLTVGINNNGSGGYTTGLTDINISDTSMLDVGDVLTFVRRLTSPASRVNTAFVEQGVVQSILSATQVRLTAAMSGNPHSDGKGFRGPDITPGAGQPPTPDEVFVTKYIWLNNKNSPGSTGTPALYKIRATNGSNVIQFSGTQFSSVGGSAFYTKYNLAVGLDSEATKYNTTVVVDSAAGGRQTYMLIARDSTLLFYNVSTNVIDRSMVMNNIKIDTVSTWNVYDMIVLGEEPNMVLYRLQNGTTYKNSMLDLVDESWSSQYNYEKQLLRRVVSSIAVTAEPSIVPADGNATSRITAVLRDQYNDTAPSGKTVNWSDDSGDDRLASAQTVTDSFGKAVNTYTSGTTEQDVKITAAITNGLI